MGCIPNSDVVNSCTLSDKPLFIKHSGLNYACSPKGHLLLIIGDGAAIRKELASPEVRAELGELVELPILGMRRRFRRRSASTRCCWKAASR